MAKLPLGEDFKPPFANYDLVVYFGGGLFSIPFILRYLIEPLHLLWPKLSVDVGSPFANEAISSLTLLFSVYILGHMIAYTASLTIEKTVDRFLGKVSSAIVISARVEPSRRNEYLRALAFRRIKSISEQKGVISALIRAFIHIPAMPCYFFANLLGFFGYYSTRITTDILAVVISKMKNTELESVSVSLSTKWYKPLEYYVMNRYPSAVPRMYNYLVISGLFRTISLLFLISLWMSIISIAGQLGYLSYILKPVMGLKAKSSEIVEYACLSVAYLFSLFSYIKFQRRYAEEAVFAFAFGREGTLSPAEI